MANLLLIIFSGGMLTASHLTGSLLYTSLLVIVLTAIVIMYACDSFEEASDFLGRNMKEGTKGRTINAIGSSLPELFTTLILLFGPHIFPSIFKASGDEGFSAGIATCAGSAIFNAVIIPAFNGEGTVKSVVNSVKRVTTSSVRPSIIIQPTARRQRPHRQVLASSDCQRSWAPRAPFRLASGKRLGKVAAASLLWILMGNTTHAIWSN